MVFFGIWLLLDGGDGFGDLGFEAGLGLDVDFLEAFGGLGDGFEAAGELALDFEGAGCGALGEGFSAVGAADDDGGDAIEGLDAADHGAAFLGGGLVAAAGWHGRGDDGCGEEG